ncbi:MAG TPA: serine/threonine-protein kinase, partial [Planctomycetota bacterium]|nr:serine/threonine-protein kinase [Planctomycetota bacterium]
MNVERLRMSLRRSREVPSLEAAVELGVLPADALRRLEDAGEDPTAEALVRRGLVSPGDLGRLRRWAEQLERAALLALRLPAGAPAEVFNRLRVPGALVGRYVKVERLGEGGMGTVHRAWDTDLSRWVALKLLTAARDAEARERFLREARTAARLDHPGIVTVYDAGQDGEECYIAMKLVEGRSLHGSRPAPREAARLIREAALAVHDAHLRGIVHRDLKPGNLLLDRSGRVFVSDFGIAREIRVDTRLTASGSLLGTPAYMAPEQARDDRSAVGPATDVYALGATLYELVAGAPPFQDDNLYELLTKVVQEEPPPLAGDRELAIVAAHCLEKDPALRYASAEALAEDLRRYLEGEPLAARPPGLLERVRRAVLRRPLRTAAPALVLLLLLALGGWSLTAVARRAEAERAADRAWDEAQGHFARKDYGRTMEAIGVYLSVRPGSDAARHLRAECERALEDQRKEAGLKKSVAEAAELQRRAVEHVKEAKALWRVRTARREQWEQLLEAALEAADAASARCPGLPGGPHIRGEVLQARGRWREAIAAFDAALAVDPALPEAYFRRGLCRLALYAEERSKRDGAPAAELHKSAALADLRKYAALRGLEEDADPEVRHARAAI